MTSPRFEASIVAALCAISAFAQAAAFNNVRLDDAYITYRYSQNLATGAGFVFNPGEHLLGTTSPGHALLGALFYGMTGKAAFPAVMAALGCAGWTAQAACAYLLLRDAIGRVGAAFVGLAIAIGATRAYLWVPLETNLVAALVLTAFVLASSRKWIACGVVAGVAVVFRADALIACAAIGVLALWSERARVWRPLAAFGVVTGAWAAFSVAYFGTIVPHTFHAKVAQGTLGGYAMHALFYPALSLAPWARAADGGAAGTLLTVVPMWGLAIAGAVVTTRRSRVLAAVAAYGVLLTLGYVALHPDTAFGWHLYPATLVFGIFALSAVVEVARRVRLPRLAVLAAACLFVVGLGFEAWLFEEREPMMASYGTRDGLDHTVAAYLAASAAPTDYVDAEEVGTVAYLSDLPMVNNAGLISDDAIGQLFAAARGRPSRVRWAILNRWESETGAATFARYRRMVFQEGRLQLTVYDLRAPGP